MLLSTMQPMMDKFVHVIVDTAVGLDNYDHKFNE